VETGAGKHCLRLQIFDLALELRSDSEQCVSAVAGLLGRFVIDEATDPTANWTRLTILTQPGESYGSPVIIFGGEPYPLPSGDALDRSRLGELAYVAVCRAIVARVRTHFLIHAAALSCGDQGIVLAGDPGYGKSTLTLALVNRGCRFLSDEFAALGRGDGLLYPFPRSLQISPGTLERTGYAGIAHAAAPSLDKLGLDPSWLGEGALGGPVPLRFVVILRDSEGTGGGEDDAPTFASVPRLVPCPHSRAALQTLKHYYDHGLAAILRDGYDGSSLRLYLDLIEAIKGATCYELLVGQLDQEIDLLWHAFGGD
jgi:hypothetical protein